MTNDIQREIRSMFVHCNVLIRKFSNCSLRVKVKLFQSYCLCFYDIALWSSYHASSMCRFRSCYNKCLKLFVGYKKYDSTTKTLLETGLPSFKMCVQMLGLIFALWSHCNNSTWSLCCVLVRLINCLSCIFVSIFRVGFIYVYLL